MSNSTLMSLLLVTAMLTHPSVSVSSEECPTSLRVQSFDVLSGTNKQLALTTSSCPYQITNGEILESYIPPYCRDSAASNSAILGGTREQGFIPSAYRYSEKPLDLTDDRVRGLLTPNPEKRNEIAKHFRELKIAMSNRISNGVPAEKLNSTQRFLLAKLNAVQLSFDPLSGPESERKIRKCAERALMPDIRVSSVGDAIEMKCGFENLPMSAIVFSLAHEIGHITDLCATTYDSQAKVPRLMGALSSIAVPQTLNGYPFQSRMTCVAEAHGQTELMRDFGQNKTALNLKRVVSTPLCQSASKEHFADIAGGEILNDYLASWPLSQEDARNGMMYVDLGRCGELKEQLIGRTPTSSEDYPRGQQRLRSFIAQPRVSTALGCSAGPPVAKLCN